MKRILILGSPGTGKSTLASQLSKQLHLPLYHLDQLFFEKNWVINPSAFSRSLATILPKDTWVIDGNYANSLAERLVRSDAVIYLDYSTTTALFGVIRRFLTYRHQTRPDMAAGCKETLRLSFLWYVLSFKYTQRRQTLRLLKQKRLPVYIFSSRKEAYDFLTDLALNNEKPRG